MLAVVHTVLFSVIFCFVCTKYLNVLLSTLKKFKRFKLFKKLKYYIIIKCNIEQ